MIQNSWGATWGAGGFALLPYEDYLMHATDVWVAVREEQGELVPGHAHPVACGERVRPLRAGLLVVSQRDVVSNRSGAPRYVASRLVWCGAAEL